MQEHRKMASVEDYSYDQSMFKFSNPPTASSAGTFGDLGGFGFPTNQLEYFNLSAAQMMDPIAPPAPAPAPAPASNSYEMMSNMDPLAASNTTPNLNIQPQVFLQNSSFLDLNQAAQHQHIPQHPHQPQTLSSTDSSSSNLTPFEHPSSSVTTNNTQFSNNNGFISEDSVFPPVDAFIPSSIDTQQQQHQQHYQRSRYLSEPNIMTATANDSPFSLSPQSITFSSNLEHPSTTNTTVYDSDSTSAAVKPLYQRYRVIRGISSGGSATKPPRIMTTINHHYVPVNLEILDAALQECCLPQWNEHEKFDKRRIIRIERYQVGAKIIAQFSIVGSAKENPTPVESQPGVDVVEVSCLECFTKQSEDTDNEDDGNTTPQNNYNYGAYSNEEPKRSFYITSVEVIKIVELLIGTEVQDPAERRRERGRIRSNLVPFWSKRPISSRMSNNEMRSNSSSPSGQHVANVPMNSTIPDYSDFRIELATRIMAYDVRKPRGFDKEVRILKWEKLVPALRRALQSYYVEIPDGQDDY